MSNKPLNYNRTFEADIMRFNTMYMLPTLAKPGMPDVGDANKSAREKLKERLANFARILAEEIDEVTEIQQKIEAGDAPEEILTAIADWLGDIQVYCASEMRKFGLDNDVVLGIIMSSNFSKLGADGKPIFDERGKVMKGPDYWRPEPMIRRYILAAHRQGEKDSTGTK